MVPNKNNSRLLYSNIRKEAKGFCHIPGELFIDYTMASKW